MSDALIVDKIVNLAHGKGEKAGREKWTSVATARHNKTMNKASEPALDLLEKYLISGKHITLHQKEVWSGDYPLTVLKDAMSKIYTKLELKSVGDFAVKYPDIKFKSEVEKIIHDIGTCIIGFNEVRSKYPELSERYGITKTPSAESNAKDTSSTGDSSASTTSTSANKAAAGTTSTRSSRSTTAHALNDHASVIKALKGFTPKGKNREKVVTLRDEAKKIKVKDTPLAFCFLLRSMFEISAKAYAKDHSISVIKGSSAVDRPLVDILRDITKDITKNNVDRVKMKELHGAMAELGRVDGILSVTSMNQLIHNTKFSVAPADVCILFNNIFPLLEAMN